MNKGWIVSLITLLGMSIALPASAGKLGDILEGVSDVLEYSSCRQAKKEYRRCMRRQRRSCHIERQRARRVCNVQRRPAPRYPERRPVPRYPRYEVVDFGSQFIGYYSQQHTFRSYNGSRAPISQLNVSVSQGCTVSGYFYTRSHDGYRQSLGYHTIYGSGHVYMPYASDVSRVRFEGSTSCNSASMYLQGITSQRYPRY